MRATHWPLRTQSRMRACPSSATSGKCWIVGSGPGSEEYLTVKAARLINSAQVVVYDDLVDETVIQLIPIGAEKVYVGKRGGRESIKQPEIDSILVDLCTQGKDVIRLKGGCPSVFSRVASELAALSAAGCPYEMVPGLSSVLVAPIMAGFPLTDVNVGSSFAVVSGHDALNTDWSAFAKMPTLVLLMAGKNLGFILDALVSTGWDPATPVAIIKSAGTKTQQIWEGTISNILQTTAGSSLSPSIVVIGQVVNLPK